MSVSHFLDIHLIEISLLIGKACAVTPPASLPQPTDIADADTGSDSGLLPDVQVTDVDGPTKKAQGDHTQDIDTFFSPPYLKNDKKYRDCNACSYVSHF